MKKKDYYDTLGVNKDATGAQIKSAYRKLAKKYHPDTNRNNHQAEQLFKEVTEAYNVLSDKEKRRLYDKFGHAAFDGSMGEDPEAYARAREEAYARRGGQFQRNPFQEGFSSSRTTWEEPFGDGSYHRYYYDGNTDDFFEDVFGDFFHQRQKGRESFKGQSSFEDAKDTGSDLTISFKEAALGCVKHIRLDGELSEELKVQIPAGIDEGQTVRLRGKGRSGINGKRGDLLIRIHIHPDETYTRKGMDVFFTGSIPYTTAILGGEARFDTLYGPVICSIPPGSQAGARLRLKGKGIVSAKDKTKYGDAFVTLQIQVPKHISDRERELLLQLRNVSEKRTVH